MLTQAERRRKVYVTFVPSKCSKHAASIEEMMSTLSSIVMYAHLQCMRQLASYVQHEGCNKGASQHRDIYNAAAIC
eukprot:2549548-Amphidinium_carterae.1